MRGPPGAGPQSSVADIPSPGWLASWPPDELRRRDFSGRSEACRERSRPLCAFAPLREPCTSIRTYPSSEMKSRADQLLVDRGLAESRAKAQALILAGLVFS